MDPRHLIHLAVIVELGSITTAARKLNVTQPTLSRTVKMIEDRVGGAVLRRERYGVRPTAIGRQLAEEGREIMRRAEAAGAAVRAWRQGLAGELRVGVGPMLAATVIGDFFADLATDPPSFSLNLRCDVAARLVERLHQDRLDVAIIPFELNRAEDGFHRDLLFRDDLAVCVGGQDPLARARRVPAKALAGHDWIAIGETSGLLDRTQETLDLLGLPGGVSRIEVTGDVAMILRLLERTQSCCVLPRRQLQTLAGRYDVAALDLDRALPSRNIGLWSRFETRDRPEITVFLARLRAYLAAVGLC